VFRFDFNSPEYDPIELELEGLPRKDDFNPHGITSWVENGKFSATGAAKTSNFFQIDGFQCFLRNMQRTCGIPLSHT
jgi:hypothetical protein